MAKKMWKINTAKDTILAIMKPYQHGIISMILEAKTEKTTLDLHVALEEEGYIISRTSVINYCQLLAANDVISFEERSCQGGMKRVYSKLMTWESILEFIHMQVLEKMTGAFPDSKYLKDVKDQLFHLRCEKEELTDR